MMTWKRMFVRSMLTAGLPVILAYAFAVELWRGIASAFRFAWLEVRINYGSYRETMRREDY